MFFFLLSLALIDAFNLLQDSVLELIKQFQDCKAIWQVRIEARRSLLDIEFYSKGIDAALLLFIKFLEEESSLRGHIYLSDIDLYLMLHCYKSINFNLSLTQWFQKSLQINNHYVIFVNLIIRKCY